VTRPITTTEPSTGSVGADGRPAWWRALLAVGWMAALIATIVLLGRLGTGTLSTPPVLDRSELRRWLDERDAVTVAFAFVRLIGLVLAWYLLAVTVVGLLARVTRVPALVRLSDLATVPAVRRFLGTVAGVGLSASAASLVAANLLPDDAPRVVESGPLVDTRVVIERLPDGSETILRRLPDSGDDGTATLRVDDGGRAGGGSTDGSTEGSTAARWTVRAGDHLWGIAEDTLAANWGRAPTDAEVAPYWDQVVDANRGALIDPGNPDLIQPGQTFVLPAPPAAPPAGPQP